MKHINCLFYLIAVVAVITFFACIVKMFGVYLLWGTAACVISYCLCQMGENHEY